jgi:hypothetical protein
VTVAVEQLEVIFPICPSVSLREDMIDFHAVSIREEQATLPTLPVLFFQELGDSGREVGVVPEPGAPIHPVPIIRAAHAVDFHM